MLKQRGSSTCVPILNLHEINSIPDIFKQRSKIQKLNCEFIPYTRFGSD